MSNNELAELVAPVYTEPAIDGYIKITEDFEKNRTPAIEAHQDPDGLIVFQEHIKKHESSWDNSWSIKPRAFETRDIANGYLSQASKAANAGIEFLEKVSEKWKVVYFKKKIEWNPSSFEMFVIWWIAGIGGTFLTGAVIYVDINKNNLGLNMLLLIPAFLLYMFAAGLMFFVLDLPSFFFRNRSYKKSPPALPSWIQERKNEWVQRLNRIDAARDEIYDDIEKNKKLIQMIKERQIDEYFSGKASARLLAERLQTIQAEVEAAINTTKNLNEQHRLTEEIRAKYAKELVDIQRQVKEENNQDLINKMAMVNNLLGD